MLNLNANKNKAYSIQGHAFEQWAHVKNKGVYGQAIQAFNQDIQSGLAILGSPATTDALLQFLESCWIYLVPKKVGECLAGSTPQHQALLQAYMQHQDYSQQAFDVAFRHFLNGAFALPDQGQQVDVLINAFADRYHQQNTQQFGHRDAVYALAFSTIMLSMNHDKITQEGFIQNNQGLNQGVDFDVAQLVEIYKAIQSSPLTTRVTLDNHASFVEQVLTKTSNPSEALAAYVKGIQATQTPFDLDNTAQKMLKRQVKDTQNKAVVKSYENKVGQNKAFSQELIIEKLLDLASRLELILKAQQHRLMMRDKKLIRQLINEIKHDPSAKALMTLPAQFDDLNQQHANIIAELKRIQDLIPQDIQKALGGVVAATKRMPNTPHPLFHGSKATHRR